eukprot:5110372-Alexandrium_andersonii.AAC.1
MKKPAASSVLALKRPAASSSSLAEEAENPEDTSEQGGASLRDRLKSRKITQLWDSLPEEVRQTYETIRGDKKSGKSRELES